MSFNFLSPWSAQILSLLRIMTGLLFFAHGSAKYFQFPHVAMFDPMQPMQPASLIGVAGILEIVGGALIAVGLFTRPVAFILSGMMAVAYFLGHAMNGSFHPILNGGEPAILFCFIFLYLSAAGGGAWSLDAMRR